MSVWDSVLANAVRYRVELAGSPAIGYSYQLLYQGSQYATHTSYDNSAAELSVHASSISPGAGTVSAKFVGAAGGTAQSTLLGGESPDTLKAMMR